ncbi:MAG: SUMF1/EgtB/PvdO family nonheme iron enzyme [Candidatus Cloacimonetes bacterium]|nr:SUMF1/EgtB/PvdO family nonheme iron enzyme [Candidatus Cloacimonadota bacterium]
MKRFYLFVMVFMLILISCDNHVFENLADTDNQIDSPDSLSITLTSINSCRLNWNDNSSGETGFIIDRKKDSEEWVIGYQTIGENVEFFTETSLEATSTYQYRVYAYAGENVSGSISAEINMTFPAPTDLTILQTFISSCELNWNYSEIGEEDGFKVERRSSGGDWELIETLPLSSTDFEDIDLTAGEVYEYKIYAFNSQCNGNPVIDSIELLYVEGMIFVEGGTFEMGDHFNEGDSDELPVHDVTLSSFFIGQYEVTQGEYEAVTGDTPSHDYGVGDNYPVYYVTWYDAVEYCNTLSEQEGLTPCYDLSDWSCDFSADGYRLPTEAEWEYAARGGINWEDNYKYSGTTDNLGDYAVYSSNDQGHSDLVGSKLPNQLDIYDMSGNVWEWCNDWYSSSYYGTSQDNNPTGPDIGSRQVLRGGYWSSNDIYCRVANRGNPYPGGSDPDMGFRILRAFPY